ncbi:MAG: hypothetical protein WAV93_08365 [Bacteroidales bacterium]
MKIVKPVFLMTALLMCSGIVSAQTADEVIAKYVKACGGKEFLSKLTSVYTESKADVMGMESAQRSTILNGKGLKTEMEVMGSVITTCITDNGGWMINPMTGSNSAEDMPEAQYNASKDQIFIGAPFTIWSESGYTAELSGNEAVGTVNAIKVKLTAPDNTSGVYFFDPETGYLIKTISRAEMQGQMVENIVTYSDYRLADGYAIPYKTMMDMGGMFELTSAVTKVELNKPVDPSFFAKP